MEQRKNPEKDLRKKTLLFFNVGMIVSLALVISAFEWRTFQADTDIVELGDPLAYAEEWMPPVSVQKDAEPPKPMEKPKAIDQFEVVPDEEIWEEAKKIVNIEPTEPSPSPASNHISVDVPDEEPAEKPPFLIVEEMPEPVGGMEAFFHYLSKNIRYPSQAKRMGQEGKVFVEFVVDKDGSLTDIKAIRGIGYGCDEEAVRVIMASKKWKPGKQRGQAVRVKMVLPIGFTLH